MTAKEIMCERAGIAGGEDVLSSVRSMRSTTMPLSTAGRLRRSTRGVTPIATRTVSQSISAPSSRRTR
jgi:hypothetical protein